MILNALKLMSDQPPQFSRHRGFASRPGHYQAAVDQQHLAIRFELDLIPTVGPPIPKPLGQ